MKALFTAMALTAIVSTPAFAQSNFGTMPAEGEININTELGGANSFSFNTWAQINRQAEGYISLYHNDILLRQIPASNVPMFYCIDESGIEKGEVGTPHVDFWYPISNLPKRAGEYRLVLPAKFLYFPDTESYNTTSEWHYTIKAAPFSITPENASKLTEISEVTVSSPVGTTITFNDLSTTENAVDPETGQMQTIQKPAVFLDNIYSNMDVVKFSSVVCEGNRAVITFDPPMSTPGTWLFNTKANVFKYTDQSGKTQPCGELSASYTIETPAQAFPVTFAPALGAYSELTTSLQVNIPVVDHYEDGVAIKRDDFKYYFFEVTPADGSKITNVMATYAPRIIKLEADGSFSKTGGTKLGMVANNGTLLLGQLNPLDRNQPSTLSLEAGDYVIYFPKMAFFMGSKSSAEMTVTGLSILPSETADYTVSPADGAVVSSLSVIEFTYPEANADTAPMTWSKGTTAILTDGIAQFNLTPQVEGATIRFTLPFELTTPGAWTLTVPQQAIRIGNNVAAPISVGYTIDSNTAIDSIISGDTPTSQHFDIFSITGALVRHNATIEDIQTLLPGVYIIEGQKILIK